MSILTKLYSGLITGASSLQSFFLLAIRLLWGWQFFQAGLTKLQDINPVAGYFESIGIHPSLFHAYAAATVELVGGALLFIGLGSRLSAIALSVVMLVALFTAYPDVTYGFLEDPVKVMELTPFTFLMTSLVVLFFGPGKFSADALIKRLFDKHQVNQK